MKTGGSGPAKDVELELSRGGAVSSTDQNNEVPPRDPRTSARAEDEPWMVTLGENKRTSSNEMFYSIITIL